MGEFKHSEHLSAIRAFLEYGEQSLNDDKAHQDSMILPPGSPGHGGYFSGPGWAACCLRSLNEELKSPTVHFIRDLVLKLTDEGRAELLNQLQGKTCPMCCGDPMPKNAETGDWDCLRCQRSWFLSSFDGEETLQSRRRKVRLVKMPEEGDRMEDIIKPVE